jgi:3-oxoadipate enol-lactonase
MYLTPFLGRPLFWGAYVSKYASTLRGLILVDTKADADTAEGRQGRDKMIQLVREKGSQAVGDAMQPKLLSPDTLKHKPAIVRAVRAMTDSNPPITLEHALAAMRDRPDRTAVPPSVRTPTLIIVGDADSITPPSVAEQMQRAIPGAQLAPIRGAGHLSPMEQPEQVNAAMARFLAPILRSP